MLPASPNGTYKTGPGTSVTDAQGVIFAINGNGQITVNGKLDPTTARVDAIGFFNGQVWQKNDDNLWFSKTSAAATWVDFPPAGGNPMPVPAPAANNQVVTVGGGPNWNQFYDTHGNLWQINASGQVVIDGRVDATTARVVAMALVNGKVWQENADGNWYSKTKPSDTWTAAVRADPVLAAQSAGEAWVGGTGGSPALGANWSKGVAPTPDRNLTMTAGVMNLGAGNLGGNTLTISGEVPIPSGTIYGGYEAVAPTINMTAGASLRLAIPQQTSNAVKVNVTGGRAALDVSDPGPGYPDVIVTADKLSSVLLSGHMAFGQVIEHGGTVLLNGGFAGNGATVLLDSNVAGFGRLDIGSGQSNRGTLEVTGSVGADVTIAMRGDPYRNAYSTVTLDDELADHGTVTLQDSTLYLKNVGPLDSMSYKNAVLSLYKGGTLVEAVKVAGVADQPGGVSNGVLNFAYSAGTLTVHDGGTAANPAGFGVITGLALHA